MILARLNFFQLDWMIAEEHTRISYLPRRYIGKRLCVPGYATFDVWIEMEVRDSLHRPQISTGSSSLSACLGRQEVEFMCASSCFKAFYSIMWATPIIQPFSHIDCVGWLYFGDQLNE